MRAICMMCVLVAHALVAYVAGIGASHQIPQELSFFMLTFVRMGVGIIDIFFIGSGFIMVYLTRATYGQPGARLEFIIRRLTRIVPAFWFYMTCAILLSLWWPETTLFQDVTAERVVKSYGFIPYFWGDVHQAATHPYPILIPGWTLNYEMVFYALFALTLFCKDMRTGIIAFAIATLTLIVAHQFVPQDNAIAYFWTHPQMMKFLGGMLIGYAFDRGVFFNIPMKGVVAIITVTVLIQAALYSFLPPELSGVVWFNLLMTILACIVGICVVLTPFVQKKLPTWLIKIGDATYTIYLSQFIIMGLIVVGPNMYFDVPWWGTAILTLIGAVATVFWGLFSYPRVEVPVSQVLRRLLLRSKQRPA